MKTHCSNCGTLHQDENYPKKCISCGVETFKNPIPVVVLLVPVENNGVLIQKRNIEPQKGKYALISGYMEVGETPEEAAKREAFEECGIKINDVKMKGFKVSKSGNLLILLESNPIKKEDIKFIPNSEVSEIKFANTYEEMAFEKHSEFLKTYFNCKALNRKETSGW